MKLSQSGRALQILKNRIGKLERAEDLAKKALNLGLTDLRSRNNLEELELLDMASEPVTLHRRATVFWRLQ